MLLVAWILLLCSSFSDAMSVIYSRTGGEVVISTGSAADLITEITWKHNEDMAVEWYEGEPIAYRHFNGCTTLNTRTGDLTISDLTRNHSGNYTALINNKLAGKTEVRIISPVPKPTVSMWCDAEMTYCTLTCEGDTTDAEPVDFSWHIFDVHNYYKGQQINLTEKNHDPWYQCEMKNHISTEWSEKFSNPFLPRNRLFTFISVVTNLLLIGLIIIILICMCVKCKSKKGKENKETEEENTGLLGVSCNGVETSDQAPHASSVVLDTSRQTATLNAYEASNPDKTSEKPNDEPEILSKKEEETQVLIHSPETPESNGQTENSPKKEEEIEALIHNPETPESSDLAATTTSEETLTSVAEKSNESATDSQDQNTSRNDLKTAASTDTEESAEESNGEETTRPLLEEAIQTISVSA